LGPAATANTGLNVLYIELNTFLKGLIDSLKQLKSYTDSIKSASNSVKDAINSAKTMLKSMLTMINDMDNNYLTPASTYVYNIINN